MVNALQVSEEARRAVYEAAWNSGDLLPTTFADMPTSAEANETFCEFLREKIRSIVKDPATAEALCPTGYYYGTKRPCLDSGYFETFNLPHVRLVDLRKTPITTITETGIRTSSESLEFDAIVFATGFDAMTGAIVAVDISGRDGLSLKQKWAEGPKTYLGLTTVGFPNCFLITGPGSPSVLSNMMVSIEQHVDWVVGRPSITCAAPGSRPSSRPRRPKPAGCSTSTTAPTSRSSRRPTPGTWAPTCPASRACSCRTSAASTATARPATKSSSRVTSASASKAPVARCATTA